MNQPARILVLATILMLAHIPVPWRHCHNDMSPPQLAAHLIQYHAASPTAELPRGWHWHVFQYQQEGNAVLAPSPRESVAEELDTSTSSRGSLAFHATPATTAFAPQDLERELLNDALAAESQRTYLRYHVLLN